MDPGDSYRMAQVAASPAATARSTRCGNIANIAIVLGKKALLAASQPIDPKIDTAIQRGTGFLGSYVNKGGIPYGEHMPTLWHASNGKDASAAVFFGLQADRAVETEYFSRMSIAGWVGVEVGHAGQELGLLWAALGAGMGGEAAASGHFKQLLWRFDIHPPHERIVHLRQHGTTTITAEAPPLTAPTWEIPPHPVSKAPPSICSPTASRSNNSTSPGKSSTRPTRSTATKVANAVSAGYFRA